MIDLIQFGNPPANLVPNAEYTIGILNEIFYTFPGQFSFNSGYRTPARNAAVGGVPDSFHVKALSGDITPLNGNYDFYKPLLTQILNKYGFELIDERHKNHFHVEPAPGWNGQLNPPGNSLNSIWWAVGVVLVVGLVLRD